MNNDNNRFIGSFDTEAEVLRKIEELKQQGHTENDMYVVSNKSDNISMVRGRTDVEIESNDRNWLDKFMDILSGEDKTRGAFDKMNLDPGEADRYHNEVKGGKILLYVDRDYGQHYNDHHAYVDDAAVASPGLTVDTNESNNTAYNTNRNLVENDERLETGRIDSTTNEQGDDVYVERDNNLNRNEPILDADRIDAVAETEEERLRLHEERLAVGKEKVQTGEVNVGKHTVEETQTVEVPVKREEVYVERRPVGEEAAGDAIGDRAYDENEEIRIPLSEERVEVNKKDVVAEEIVVGKRKVEDTETVTETVRHEEADIEGEVDEKARLDRDRDGRL